MRKTIPTLASVTIAGALIATTAIGGIASPALANGPDKFNKSDKGRAQNVILLVGDGMGRTHVTAGRERFEGAAGLLRMETLPSQGYVKTYAVEENSGQPGEPDFVPNLVTDSASSATAWASGVKSYNAALGVDAKGTVVPTAMELAKQAGYRTGNVSTAEITDATPAGQMSHVLARGCQGPVYSAASCQNTDVTGAPLGTNDIRVTPVAKQIARNGTADVIFGGGLGRFDAADEQALEAQGYSVLGSIADKVPATRTDLQAATGEKVFGLFNTGNLTVEKTKRENPSAVQAAEPSLPEMTGKAIEVLAQDKKQGKGKGEGKGQGKSQGFFLQVEGALIDKRSHANDAAQTLEEIKAFDDAVAVAMDFAERDGNTLVIVTADHECAGFNIIEKGSFTNAEAVNPPGNVDSGNTANNSTPTRPGRSTLDPTRSTGPINGAGSANPNNFAPATFRTADDAADVQDGSPEASLWLSYLSGNHTGADVPIYSYGPGSNAMNGTLDNTDLFGIMTDALRLRR
ncbi:alkaline phosphatase [Vibrio cholerae]|nr:alkaline phosphatase [Vibrio cholerae]